MDYRDVFGKETALGLGLGQSPRKAESLSAEDYHRDPADAFSRAAELNQPKGGAVPIPFATVVDSKEPRP